MACHLRFAAQGARLRFPEIDIATIPLLEERNVRRGWWVKPRRWSSLLQGSLIESKEALEIGLLNDIFPDETFREEILEVAKKDSQKESSCRVRSVRFGHSWCR